MDMYVLTSILCRDKYFFLKTDTKKVDISERKKKVGDSGSIWDADFAANFKQKKIGEWITGGGLVRVGVSTILLEKMENGNKRVILSRFDDGHPTMPGKLSPPAGVWQSGRLKEAALAELGEEVILVRDGMVFYWEYKSQQNEILSKDCVNNYAKDHKLNLNTQETFRIRDNLKVPGMVSIYLDGKYQGEAFLAIEPENGGLEIMFVFMAEKNNFWLLDGERLPNGTYLDREVNWYEKYQLKDELQQGHLTTKAQMILEKII
jgi:hypothetical protein